MRVTDLLCEAAIELDSAADTTEKLLDRLVLLQCAHGTVTDPLAYRAAVYAREALGSTYISKSVAIPHAKTSAVSAPGLALLRPAQPVYLHPGDPEPTRLLLLIAAPETASELHIQVLARMCTMLMDDAFVNRLYTAPTRAALLAAIEEKETALEPPQEDAAGLCRVLAVTGCPNGIAHTYMAADALRRAARRMGVSIQVETDGADGVKNRLTPEAIAACEGIIVASDVQIQLEPFVGRPVLCVGVQAGIREPEALLRQILDGVVPALPAGHVPWLQPLAAKQGDEGEKAATAQTAAPTENMPLRRIKHAYRHLMNGVSHMLPFVAGGGVLTALAFLVDDYSLGAATFGQNTPLACFLTLTGQAALAFMLPILSAYIASSIADRPGLAVGFAGGVLAMQGTDFASLAAGKSASVSGGFLAAVLAGFLAGFLVRLLERVTSRLPEGIAGLRPMLIYPIFGLLALGAVMCLLNPAVALIHSTLFDWLNGLSHVSRIVLGAILGAMMAADLGGPINKAAYVFGTAAISAGNLEIMAAVMAGGMVPPLAIALSTTLFPGIWNEHQRHSGTMNYLLGLCFITEGAIPFVAAEPLLVLPGCVVGSMVAGALACSFGCTVPAPHGGIFVLPVMGHPQWFVLALALGAVAGMLMISAMRHGHAVLADSDKE